jgi:hypothetical protein
MESIINRRYTMKKSPAEIRWEGHQKHVSKHLKFRPEYAAQITHFAKERNISQRELIESCLKEVLGSPNESQELIKKKAEKRTEKEEAKKG